MRKPKYKVCLFAVTAVEYFSTADKALRLRRRFGRGRTRQDYDSAALVRKKLGGFSKVRTQFGTQWGKGKLNGLPLLVVICCVYYD
jgi:hypothetical protein